MSVEVTKTKGVLAEDFEPSNIEEMGGMIGKVAEQVIRGVEAVNPLNVFDKNYVENGDTVEQAVILMAEGRAYDKQGLQALTRKTPSLAVRYFREWNRLVYDTSVDIPEIRKVLLTGKGAEDVSTKIVSALSEGDTNDKYQYTKELFKFGRQDQDGKVFVKLDDVAYDNGIDYQAVLVKIKDTVKGMQFVNTTYNTAGIKRKTIADDIYIVMDYELKNRLDVEELSGVFNLDKADIKNKIIEIDGGTETIGGKKVYPVYIVDKWAVLNYTRLFEMADQKNADGLFWNYFLHTDRMYALSQLFDGCYFNVITEE